MARVLAIVMLAFKAWMFVDCIKRRAEQHWFWVIMIIPGGSLIYFVMVRMRDADAQMMKRRFLEGIASPPSLDQLEAEYGRTPSFQNRTRLAQGLADAGRFAEAIEHFEALREKRPDDKDALYGQGVCLLEAGRPEDAIAPLERLLEKHRGYREYAAWPELAEALHRTGRVEECRELLGDLVRVSPRLGHHVLRAQFLMRHGDKDEARSSLEAALEAEKASPKHVRRMNRAWERQAKQLIREAG